MCRNTFIGSLHRFFMVKIPDKMAKYLQDKYGIVAEAEACLGKGGTCRYFMFTFYTLIYSFLFLVYIYQIHPYKKYIFNRPWLATLTEAIIFPIPWIMILLIKCTDPGCINKYNVKGYMKNYPIEGSIYQKKICRTLKIPAVPRSRYCRFTNRRVAKYDHYCPWVLSVIGERTHRYFFFFLLFDCINCIYFVYAASIKLILIMKSVIKKVKWTKKLSRNIYMFIIICTRVDVWTFFSAILAFIVVISLLVFIFQQAYHISINVTQIESEKLLEEKELRERNGDFSEVVNIYDKGILRNWFYFLFPKSVEISSEPWTPNEEWAKIISDQSEDMSKKDNMYDKKGKKHE